MNEEEIEPVEMYGIWIVGGDSAPYALFRTEEFATDWARDNYFGQWLMKKVTIPYTPLFTQKEWDEAMIEGAKMAAKFRELPQAEDHE